MKESDIAYLAGLFDGEGSIHYKKGLEKKKKHKGKPGYRVSNSWRINMEITMTDPMVINWVFETLKVIEFLSALRIISLFGFVIISPGFIILLVYVR